MVNNFVAAFRDFREGLLLAPVWSALGWDQTVGRFRRTVLGPFWLSSGLLTLALALTFVFGGLFGTDWHTNFPHVLLGVLAWQLIGGPLAEATGAFTTAGGIMQVHRTPLTFPIFLHALRTLVNFTAQLITAVVVLLLARLMKLPDWSILPAVALNLYITFMMSLLIAIPSTRYRDLGQIVSLLVGLLFFTTPVFWDMAQMSASRRAVVGLNPLAHQLELVRMPLMGVRPPLVDWAWALGAAGVATVLAFCALAFFRKRVIFWL